MSSDRFAEVKRLYAEVCDLAEPQRSAHLNALGADPELVAEVMELLGHDAPRATRFARPVLHFLADLGSESLLPGSVLGVWKLERQIAHGGMGTVFLAQRCDGHFEQTVAIKLLRGIASADALAYLSQERQILARLTHPNIARLLDGGATPKGQPYLVMEYIEGSAVDDFCRARQLGTTALLQLFQTLCAAVSAAHQRLIVHCDLKPSNILVTADGRPLLLDFGIAQLVGAAAGASDADAGSRAYTPRYASPEQRAGQALSTASDIYSLGMLLAELLLNRQRAADDTSALLPERIAEAELRAIALKATRADPGQRYVSVDALAQDLQRYMRNEPVQARGASNAYRLRKLLQRRWPWVSVGMLFLVLTTVFVLRLLSERDRAQAAEANAIAERDRARQADAASRRVSEFLVSVFDGSDPDAGTGNVPAATLVQQAVARIDELRDEPMVQSKMYATLARIQHLVGNPEQAQLSYQKAIAVERHLDRPLELASHLHGLATLEIAAISGQPAERDARAALALREQYAEPLAIAESLALLGNILVTNGRVSESEHALRRALRIHQGEHPRSIATANALEDLADVYQQSDKVELAIEHYRLSLELLDAIGPEGEDSRISVQHSLARALSGARRYDEAESLLRRLLEQNRLELREDNDDIAWQLAELGRLLVSAGKPLQALPLYAEALEIGARKIGVDTLGYAVLLNNAATAFERSGDWTSAEDAYLRALAIIERSRPENDMSLAQMRHNFGRLQLRMGKLADSGARLLAAEPTLSVDENLDSATLARIDIAEWRLVSGQLDEAEADIERVLQNVASLPGRLQAAALRVRGLLHAQRGDHSQALRVLADAEERMRADLGDRDARSWIIRVDRAALLIASADVAQQRDGAVLLAGILEHIEPLMVPDAPLLKQLRAMRRS
jgi:eukaryotic-like serine/threonine-protein kinase